MSTTHPDLGHPTTVADLTQRPGRRQSAGYLQLTRRGQIVMVIAVLGLLLLGWVALGAPTVATDHANHAVTRTVVVEPGQTLWDIASTAAPDQDPRVVIADIEDLNAISDPGDLVAGQPLDIPLYR